MNVIKKYHDEPVAGSAGRRAIEHLFDEYELARKERDAANARLARFSETIQLLIDDAPDTERVELSRRFEDIRKGQLVSSRGGDAFNNIISLFRRDRRDEWAISEIQSELEKAGAEQDPKALYNALAYMAKKGSLRRVARGRYVIVDSGLGVEMEGYDDGTSRVSEHDV